jgi:hypothetical protein
MLAAGRNDEYPGPLRFTVREHRTRCPGQRRHVAFVWSGTSRQNRKERIIMWWADLLWGLWNGLTAWIILIVHVFGGWEQFPFYNEARSGNWYDFGFLLGAGSPLLGSMSGRRRRG